jgi:hypothetical protein
MTHIYLITVTIMTIIITVIVSIIVSINIIIIIIIISVQTVQSSGDVCAQVGPVAGQHTGHEVERTLGEDQHTMGYRRAQTCDIMGYYDG